MNIGAVHQVQIEQEMRDAYLDYAMSVIVARALPDARDGLKPVHRRILYAMHDMGIRSDTSHKKSARIVGEVLGKYHPHGDAAVYDTMVRLAQDFSMRYSLVDGQGNYGSIYGDNAAAMRYTEARMAEIGEEMLVDIGKETVDFVDNFDGSLSEPSVLPASYPNLLVNGASGIAVGMSTSVPPHNLGEVCDALIYMIEHWNKLDDITVQDLMRFIKGPDFPTGGLVYRHGDGAEDGDDSLVGAYATGRGKVIVRAKAHIEDMGRGKSRIIISEVPYQVNLTSLIERIATLARNGKIEGLADLRDESDRQGLRLVIELQRGVDPAPVLAELFRQTQLQETFSVIMLALVDNEPRILSLKQALKVYLDHRQEVVKRRSEYDLARAQERAHILEGLLKALDNLDQVIQLIRKSRTPDTAKDNLMKALKISEIQARAILDMPLRRLAALEAKKIDDEHKEKVKLIKYLEGLLKNPKKMREVVAEELTLIKQAYGDARRTIITDSTATTSAISIEDLLIPEENTWLTLTLEGKVGRSYDDSVPKITATMKDPPRFIVQSTTGQTLYLFTANGMCATVPVQQINQVEEPSDGMSITDIAPLKANDEVVAALSLPTNLQTGFLFLTTTDAQVKRIRLEDLPGMKSDAFTVMNVSKDAKLGWVHLTTGQDHMLLTTSQAQAICFNEDEVRPTGLPAGGMRGIKLLGQRDRVVDASIAIPNQYVWCITDDGVAKVSPVSEYPVQGRAGQGVITMRLPNDSSELAAAAVGRLEDNIVVLTSKGKAKYMRISRAPRIPRGRNGGDYITSLGSNEIIASVVTFQELIVAAEPVAE